MNKMRVRCSEFWDTNLIRKKRNLQLEKPLCALRDTRNYQLSVSCTMELTNSYLTIGDIRNWTETFKGAFV